MRLRNTLRSVLPLLVFLVLSGSALAQKITTDFDHVANYRTYAWTDGTYPR